MQAYARVSAEVSRRVGRRAPWVANVGSVEASDTSQARALAALGESIAAVMTRGQEDPSLWWDAGNSQLWIAVPDVIHGGHKACIVRITPDGPQLSLCTSSGSAPASEALAGAVGMVRITSRR